MMMPNRSPLLLVLSTAHEILFQKSEEFANWVTISKIFPSVVTPKRHSINIQGFTKPWASNVFHITRFWCLQQTYICFDFYFHRFQYLRFADYFQIIDFTHIGIPQKATYLQKSEREGRERRKIIVIRKFIFMNETSESAFTPASPEPCQIHIHKIRMEHVCCIS